MGLSGFLVLPLLLVLTTIGGTEVEATRRVRTVNRGSGSGSGSGSDSTSKSTSLSTSLSTSESTSTSPTQCEPGSYSPSGMSPCTPCPPTTFTNYARTQCLSYKLISTEANKDMFLDSNEAHEEGDLAHYSERVPDDNQRWLFDNTIDPVPTTTGDGDEDACGPNNQFCGMWYTVQSIEHNLCYDSNDPPEYQPHFMKCDPTNTNQVWIQFGASGSHVQSMSQRLNHDNLCLDSNNPQVNGHMGHMDTCKAGNPNQQWMDTTE